MMETLTAEVVKNTHLPVTVKTRLGWDESTIRIVEVALRLQDAGIKALSIHARTRAQMYKGEANWDWIAKVKQHPDIEIPIFGNGDIDSPQKAKHYYENYGVDGIMIGRATIGAPWFFRQVKHYFATGEVLPDPPLTERAQVARRHLEMSLAWKGPHAGVVEMRRHYGPYFRNVPNFKETRHKLVTCYDAPELLALLRSIEEGHLTFAEPEPTAATHPEATLQAAVSA
jgi:hypothetical protein